jgi:tRNA 2-thiouridine synthesizing protein A
VLELKLRLDRLRPGHVLKLVALDPGAPADLPAWCRMTGHTLVSATHPVYLIRRKER